jgi:hypothetical protein
MLSLPSLGNGKNVVKSDCDFRRRRLVQPVFFAGYVFENISVGCEPVQVTHPSRGFVFSEEPIDGDKDVHDFVPVHHREMHALACFDAWVVDMGERHGAATVSLPFSV